ncbi:hypothetical protein [Flavobacterium ardleyense]|uniref:hypothetical protein n=1 Tax=Flavobacterium ardleyense TaxID=2038737 RepID=UPI00298D0F67|nr:hypothetical protein [Flavobacterium ardleyense]
MKQSKFLILIIIICIQLFVGCKNIQKETITGKDSSKNNLMYKNDIVSYQFIFPDTAYVGKSYDGKIKYQGILDSITTKFEFDENKTSRYVNFLSTITEKDVKNMEQLTMQKIDTIGALDNNTILLSDIKFKKTGTFYIDGIISDVVYIPTNKKDKDDDSLFRKIANDSRATHKVVVIEKPN